MLSGAQWSHRATMGPLRTGVMRGGRGTRTLAHLTHHFSQDGSSAEHDNVTWGTTLQPGSVPGQVGDCAASPEVFDADFMTPSGTVGARARALGARRHGGTAAPHTHTTRTHRHTSARAEAKREHSALGGRSSSASGNGGDGDGSGGSVDDDDGGCSGSS